MKPPYSIRTNRVRTEGVDAAYKFLMDGAAPSLGANLRHSLNLKFSLDSNIAHDVQYIKVEVDD